MKNLLRYPLRSTLAIVLLALLLVLVDMLCYQVTLPVEIGERSGNVTLSVGSIHLALGAFAQPQSLRFVPHNPLIHEYQIDGSDSTNNRDLDTSYLQQIAGSPYYRWQAWMRDLDGTSRWRDLEVGVDEHEVYQAAWPAENQRFSLPNTTTLRIRVQLQRPETPMSLMLILRDHNVLEMTLDRNNRQITVSERGLDINKTIASVFFPVDPAPFAAMVMDSLTRMLLWASLLLLAVQACEAGLGWLLAQVSGLVSPIRLDCFYAWRDCLSKIGASFVRSVRALRHISPLPHSRQTLHPVTCLALICSLAYVIWIARVAYNGQPHIYDASAYFFTAKTFASGQVFAPAPPISTAFSGPFMVIFQGRWFGQYEPGTALTLVPGFWLGMPWLVEPILGTLALLGIGLIAARLYNQRVATLAVILGCLSPFYSFLAASYLSHAVALFYLVWGLWALLRFVQGEAGWNIILSAGCFGMAVLTRDLVALLFIMILVPGVVLLIWNSGEKRAFTPQRLRWWVSSLIIAVLFGGLYIGYNLLLTGDAQITPRSLFFAGDIWGFGPGIGFYGQHTLAAGFVNLDELLTILQIDLFGWPFSFTLAFLAIPFLTGRAQKVDWFMLTVLTVTTASYIGYFYHGIYLGPRYLFEELPFLLILSARGMLTLGSWALEGRQMMSKWLRQSTKPRERETISVITLLVVCALILCNLLYYTPRQIARYQNDTGLADLRKLDISQIYQSPVHHAIVLTDDLMIYQVVLFPLNSPTLNGDVVYAVGSSEAEIQALRRAFPDRVLYLLVIYGDGSIHYIQVT